MVFCGTYPVTMDSSGGHVGGLTCENGAIAGQYVMVQNFYEMAYLSLSEVSIYGMAIK